MYFFTVISTRCTWSNLPRLLFRGRRVRFAAFTRLFMALSTLGTWFEKFSDAVQWFGMHRCQSNHSVFFIMAKRGRTLLLVYDDDIIITGDDS